MWRTCCTEQVAFNFGGLIGCHCTLPYYLRKKNQLTLSCALKEILTGVSKDWKTKRNSKASRSFIKKWGESEARHTLREQQASWVRVPGNTRLLLGAFFHPRIGGSGLGMRRAGSSWQAVGEQLWRTYTFLDSSLEIAFRAWGTFSTMANLHLLRMDLIFGKSQGSSEPKVVNQVGDQGG